MIGAIRTFATSFALSTKVRKNSSEESNDKSEEFFLAHVDIEVSHVTIRFRTLSATSFLRRHRTTYSFFCTFALDE